MRRDHALVLALDDDAARTISGFIRMLSKKYGSPVFEPHVTLLGGISRERAGADALAECARRLAECSTLPINFVGAGLSDLPLRPLFFYVARTRRLLHLRSRAEELLALPGPPLSNYTAHLPLACGAYPRETLGEMLASISPLDFRELAATAVAIEVWETGGMIDEWKRLAGFPFASVP